MREDKSLEYLVFDSKWPPAVIARRHSRRLSLRVRADGVPLVSAPKRVSNSQIQTWLRSKQPWLRRQLERQNNAYAELSGEQLTSTIGIRHVPSTSLQAEFKDSTLILYHPPGFNQWHQLYQLARPVIKQALQGEATGYFPLVVSRLVAQTRQEPSIVRTRFMRSRWGSCSPSNAITLNSQLMRLPDELIDYVVIHELTHLTHRHHQDSFWRTIARIVPDYQLRRRKLLQLQLFD